MGVICNICGGEFSGIGPGPEYPHETRKCAGTTPQKLRERISSLEAENRRMREALEQSLRQWKMYAELEEERDLEAEVTPEADLYRLARAALIHCDPLSGKGASKGV